MGVAGLAGRGRQVGSSSRGQRDGGGVAEVVVRRRSGRRGDSLGAKRRRLGRSSSTADLKPAKQTRE